MSAKSSANRYARALFDVTIREGALSQVERDLWAIADVFREHAGALQPALSQGIPDTARRAVVEALADKLGTGTLVRKLVGMLGEGGRLRLVPLEIGRANV